jgi:DNA modification methylase
MCGDSTSIDAVDKLMNGQKADMVFTDPPYGMRLNTDYSKMGATKTKYREVIGDHQDFNAQEIFGVIQSPIYYLWGADYYSDTIPLYKDGSYFVWSKAQSESENSVFGSRFELCWRYPKRKKEVWFVRGINQSSERLGKHPTQKPTQLTIRALELETKPKAIVVDLFGGSGSTLIGCEKINRHARLMELDPKYCDVIVKRWEDFTGKKAELLNGNDSST